MKIKPGWDVDVVREVRAAFPKIRLMADANSAYTLADADRLKKLDEFNLMMIEQPLAHDEIIDHVELAGPAARRRSASTNASAARIRPSRRSA